jgi:hypothetical protein
VLDIKSTKNSKTVGGIKLNIQKARRLAKNKVYDTILNCGGKIENTKYSGKKYGKHVFMIEVLGENFWELKKVWVSDKKEKVQLTTIKRVFL